MNNMKLNKNKCNLLVSGQMYENVWVKMGDEKLWESRKKKLLGMEIGRNFNFDDHVRGGSRYFEKGGRSMSTAMVEKLKSLGFRWSKKDKITLLPSVFSNSLHFYA